VTAVPRFPVRLLPLLIMPFFGCSPRPYHDAEVAACDRAVATLLVTGDRLELERSKFIVRHLDCQLGPRLPPPQARFSRQDAPLLAAAPPPAPIPVAGVAGN
jgi:hypothetical protein